MTSSLATLLLAVSTLTSPPPSFDADAAVTLDHNITFLGARMEPSVPLGGDLHVELFFRAPTPLPPNLQVFLHLEAPGSACRVVDNRPPPAPDDGLIRPTVTLHIANTPACANADLNLFIGLYDPASGLRVSVRTPPSADDRILAAQTHITPAATPPAPPRTFSPTALHSAALTSHLTPWTPWLLALAATALLAFFLSRRRRHLVPPPLSPAFFAPSRLRGLLFVLILAAPLITNYLAGLDFIKDDAYISFRYAQNLVAGHGLVFNPGEYVEGITNFLWTLLMVPFEALHLDLFLVSEALGLALWAALLVLLVRLALLWAPRPATLKSGALLWGAVWLASSSSMARWSHSGMEQALAMFLPLLSAYLLWRLPPGSAPPPHDTVPRPLYGNHDTDARAAFLSGLFMGLGALTRPELHAIALALGLPLILRVIRERRLSRAVAAWFIGLFLVLIPAHTFRYLYYGSLIPNTFYVKTGSSSTLLLSGLDGLRELFSFNLTGLLAILAPLAFVDRRHRLEKLVALAIAVGFMLFTVRVGVDEMKWHRLYLPALPFLVLLAASGLMNLMKSLAAFLPIPGRRAATWTLGWALVAIAAVSNIAYTSRHMGGFNGRGDLAGTFHPDLGKFITRHDRPGALVAFQDMGSTPYYAPDMAFLDFIGLVDATIAHARYDYGLHAFVATESSKNQPRFNADMRAYFYQRNPEWVILTTYVPTGAMEAVWRRFSRSPTPAALEPFLRQNSYQFGLVNPTFNRAYTHVRTWPRSAGYYLSLYRRTDLWRQTPGEVVLDAPPPNLSGPTATFDGQLELLGASIQPSAKQRYEAFLTTTWRLPGPLPPDTWFFFHFERIDPELPPYRVPFDTLPGDFMYPADRWQPGQILEHRVLFQVPWDMPLGRYRVMAGVYNRTTGDRLKLLSPKDGDGEQRLELGTLEITPLSPPWDALIPPLDLNVMRQHPERIIDHGRKIPN